MHHAAIDRYAYQDSCIHQLDSRCKLLVTLAVTVAVLSLPPLAISPVFYFAIGPFALLVLAGIPLRFVFKHIALVSPFILVLALSCPFYDRTAMTLPIGPHLVHTTAGWVRCLAILSKFMVSMLALIGLVSTTRFTHVLVALQTLRVPNILVMQLGFLYRYIFVLIEQVHQVLRARNIRRLRYLGLKQEIKLTTAMIGSLLIRCLDTAEQINITMAARGFSGQWHSLSRPQINTRDWLFLACSLAYLTVVTLMVTRTLA
jgi:cobalt/nickel transport system permease protein